MNLIHGPILVFHIIKKELKRDKNKLAEFIR